MEMIAIQAVMGGIGAGISAYGTYFEGKASENAARYNANVKDIEAQIAEEQAAYKSSEIVNRNRYKTHLAAAGAIESGLELTGTYRDMLRQSTTIGQQDADMAIYEGSIKAYGSRLTASRYRADAENYGKAAIIGAGAKLLGVAASSMNKASSLSSDFNFSSSGSSGDIPYEANW